MTTAREQLIDMHLDRVNNYLTNEKWSEHNGLWPEDGDRLLETARQVYNSRHPEA